MGHAVHRFLEEFASEEQDPGPQVVHQLRPRVAPAPSEPPKLVSRIADAYARGYEEGQAAARAEARAELDAVHSSYRQQLDRAAFELSDRLADELAGKLRRQLGHLHASIADQVASALVPVLQHALTEASVRELADGLCTLTQESGPFAVELRGPADLVDRVWNLYGEKSRGLGRESPEVRFTIDETAEVRVIVNDGVIESRLMEWVARVVEAVG